MLYYNTVYLEFSSFIVEMIIFFKYFCRIPHLTNQKQACNKKLNDSYEAAFELYLEFSYIFCYLQNFVCLSCLNIQSPIPILSYSIHLRKENHFESKSLFSKSCLFTSQPFLVFSSVPSLQK